MKLINLRDASNRIMALAMLFLVLSVQAFGQDIQISVNAKEITTDDAFVISISISGNVPSQVPTPNFPAIQGMQMTNISQQSSWINGKTSYSLSRSYYPQAPGTFNVPAMSYELNGKKTSSPAFKLVVKKGNGRQQNANSRRDPFEDFFQGFGQPKAQPQPQNLQYKSLDADYFLSVNLDKESCLIGEQVHGDIVLYVAERDAGKIKVDGMAIFEMQQRIKNTGFWQENIELKEIPAVRAQINGKNYITYTLYKTILFPIKTGDIAFEDIYLDGMKLAVATNASPIMRFMGQDMKYEKIRIKAANRKLIVKPLPPTNLPDANMVGKFKLSGGLKQKEIKTGENLELEIKIAGNGNMAMMADPIVPFPESFETYEPSSQFNSRVQGNGLLGDKTWKWSMLPARAGDFDLGPIRFYYFDNEKGRYDSLVVPELKVKVTGEDIENQRISKSGTDSFYSNAFQSAKTSMSHSNQGSAWILFVGMLMVMGILIYAFIQRRKMPKGKAAANTPTDFWNS